MWAAYQYDIWRNISGVEKVCFNILLRACSSVISFDICYMILECCCSVTATTVWAWAVHCELPRRDWATTTTTCYEHHDINLCIELWTHWPQSFCCGHQRETLGSFGHSILMAAHESTTAKFSLITYNRWCTAPQKGPGYSFSLQPSQVHVPRPPTRCHSQFCPF